MTSVMVVTTFVEKLMIKEVEEIVIILDKIHVLLIKVNEIEWAKHINEIKEEFESATQQEIKIVARKIINSFGGMGSFNDIVFYVNNKADQELNQSFDNLRHELFSRLKELL